ncbi:MAG: hypothetical protein COA44_13235 [Arcobacter sp.]|nr:MAG: hypothetical protein COA44_13235 [Arcobacter sp.]
MTNNKLTKKDKTSPLISEEIFKKWLDENISRFKYKPIINVKGGFCFQSITKGINLHIDFSQPEAFFSFDDVVTNENYDLHTIEYIGREKHHPDKGFYDADRVDGVYTYYDTYAELIITEVFEKIIQYCNENFKEENAFYLINYGGATEGFIASTNEEDVIKIKKVKHKNNKDVYYLKYSLFEKYK